MYGFYVNSPYHPLAVADLKSLMPGAKSIITTVYDYSQKSFPKELTDDIARIYQARCYDAPPDYINGARTVLMQTFLRKLKEKKMAFSGNDGFDGAACGNGAGRGVGAGIAAVVVIILLLMQWE